MSPQNFKTHIKKIREEAIEIGFSITTMDGYLGIWNEYIKWKNEDNFEYREDEYSKFLLEHYNFDVSKYTKKSKSRYQQLMRSKRILDDFDTYKEFMVKTSLPNSLFCNYPKEWNPILEKYLTYCKEVRCNSDNTIKVKRDYLVHLLSYFSKNKINDLKAMKGEDIITFINETIDKGKVSKRRTFYVLREFLNYLFIEQILQEDLSILVPKIKQNRRIKIPTYLKTESVEELLGSISKESDIEKRDYVIILIAARLGLRVNEILNIKLKDIDWRNNKIKVHQSKNNNINILPLSKEIGWSIINYIKGGRPKCNNEYLFVKHKYPFEKLNQFNNFNKYFEKADIDIEENNKKGIHNLRHSLATNMLNKGIPLPIIASSLGDSIETTSNTYLKVDKNRLKECYLEVEDE